MKLLSVVVASALLPFTAEAGDISKLIQGSYGESYTLIRPAGEDSAGISLGSVFLRAQECANPNAVDNKSPTADVSASFQSAGLGADAAVLLGIDAKLLANVVAGAIVTSDTETDVMFNPDVNKALATERKAGCALASRVGASMLTQELSGQLRLTLVLKEGEKTDSIVAAISSSLGEGFAVAAGSITAGPLAGDPAIQVQSLKRVIFAIETTKLTKDVIDYAGGL